ncbi:DEAD-box ATP-dependent RNA helicase 28 [Linum grandiflorum]
MITHREEIFSRPKATSENGNRTGNDMMSAQQAEDLKMKEKRKREREKNMPRRQRRKLQAAREMLEDEEETKPVGKGKKEEEKAGLSLVDLGYRRAKAVKAVKRAKDAGKFVEKKAPNKGKRPAGQRNQSRTEEMKDLFQTDMSDRKVKKGGSSGLTKKSKSSFKSKSRYALVVSI